MKGRTSARGRPLADLDARWRFPVRFGSFLRLPAQIMSPPTPSELKKLLLAEGFEVYRTLSDQIVLADRVRDNLIMDSGVAARLGDVPCVRLVVRAQGGDFPNDSIAAIFERARQMANDALARGYREVGANSVEVRD